MLKIVLFKKSTQLEYLNCTKEHIFLELYMLKLCHDMQSNNRRNEHDTFPNCGTRHSKKIMLLAI